MSAYDDLVKENAILVKYNCTLRDINGRLQQENDDILELIEKAMQEVKNIKMKKEENI